MLGSEGSGSVGSGSRLRVRIGGLGGLADLALLLIHPIIGATGTVYLLRHGRDPVTLLPWGLLAAGSILLAFIFGLGLGVPSQRPPGARGAIIRWAHALVWILLAAMFLAIAGGTTTGWIVAPLGLLALVIYVTFLTTLFGSARR